MNIVNLGTEFYSIWAIRTYDTVVLEKMHYPIKRKMHGIICDDIFELNS
jgi:hypothetical protein